MKDEDLIELLTAPRPLEQGWLDWLISEASQYGRVLVGPLQIEVAAVRLQARFPADAEDIERAKGEVLVRFCHVMAIQVIDETGRRFYVPGSSINMAPRQLREAMARHHYRRAHKLKTTNPELARYHMCLARSIGRTKETRWPKQRLTATELVIKPLAHV